MAKNPRLIDLSGRRFGLWTVGPQAGNTAGGGALWACQCDCGVERRVLGADLRNGKSTGCGCTSVGRLGDSCRKHSATGSRLHRIWVNMRKRCRNPNTPKFENYGGRGITICSEWNEFVVFEAWALANGYEPHLSIERKDVNGNYTPENCTWADAATQSANRRFVSRAPDGELWWHKARANGITWAAYQWRLSDGWPHELAVTWPMNKRRVARQRDDSGRFA
jgi:hypothetical protein